MRDLEPIYWQFDEFGLVGTVAITRLECDIILQGCERMRAAYDWPATEEMIRQVTRRLQTEAALGTFSEAWLANAAMLVCLRGLWGEDISRFQARAV